LDKVRVQKEWETYKSMLREKGIDYQELIGELGVKKDMRKRENRGTAAPNAPRYPRTAYVYFCHYMKEVIKKETPDMIWADMGKEQGRRWNALPMEERRPYQAKVHHSIG